MNNTAQQSSAGPTIDPSITARLNSVALRLRNYLLVEGVAWVLAATLVCCSVQLFLDYITHGLRFSMRLVLALLVAFIIVRVALRRLIGPLRVAITPTAVANLVERRNPHLASSLISAVRFAAGDVGTPDSNAPSLMARVVQDAGTMARSTNFDGVLTDRRAKKSGFVILAVVLTCVVSGLVMPDILGVWFARNVLLRDVDWPRRTILVVNLPGDELIAARGDDVVIEATADGVQPRSVEFLFDTASGKSGREMMVTIGSSGSYRYQYTFKNAQEDFTFHLRGGDDRTADYNARLLERPRLVGSSIEVTPPSYSKLDRVVLGDGQRAAQVLSGSRVTLIGRANKPIATAQLMADSELVSPATVEADAVSAAIIPEQTRTYHFDLIDEVGLENRQPLRYSIRVMRDEPPLARLRIPDVGAMITPQAILPLEVEFSDTYGLAQVEIACRPSRENAEALRIDVPGFVQGIKTLSTSVSWPVAKASMQAGESVTLLTRATDFDEVSGPNTTESPEISLRVVTADELLAELARREQESRMDFERLVDAQEQLRSALLSAFDSYNTPGAAPEELTAALVPLERRQRNIAGSVNALRQQFEQILAELRVNQLNSRESEERIGTGIAEPLTMLAKRELVLAADLIRQWSRDAAPDSASRIDPQQAEVLLQMREVLSRMIQWEGYQEAVNMLRDILRLESELNEETKRKIEDQAGDIFEK